MADPASGKGAPFKHPQAGFARTKATRGHARRHTLDCTIRGTDGEASPPSRQYERLCFFWQRVPTQFGIGMMCGMMCGGLSPRNAWQMVWLQCPAPGAQGYRQHNVRRQLRSGWHGSSPRRPARDLHEWVRHHTGLWTIRRGSVPLPSNVLASPVAVINAPPSTTDIVGVSSHHRQPITTEAMMPR